MSIVAVMNYKGGVGKTTLTANLGGEVAKRGHRVLLIDLDPQANLTFSFYSLPQWHEGLDQRTIKQWYEGDIPGREVPLSELIVTPEQANDAISDNGGRLDLISSHLGLIDIDLHLASKLGGTTLQESKRRYLTLHGCLRRALQDKSFDDYDLVLIDCAPNFGLVTKTAIVASDHVLVPAKADYLSTLGISYLAGSCDKLVEEYNDYVGHGPNDGTSKINPRFLGIVFTMVKIYAARPIGTQQNYIEEVRANAGLPVLSTVMRDSPRHYGDAGARGIPAMLTAPMSDDVATEFRHLAEEIMQQISLEKGGQR